MSRKTKMKRFTDEREGKEEGKKGIEGRRERRNR